MKRPIMEALYWLLIDGGFPETLHMFEMETRICFNANYFYSLIRNGDYDRARTYLSAFSPEDDNPHSIHMFRKLTRQKRYEPVSRDPRNARESLIVELRYHLRKNPRTMSKLNCPTFKIGDLRNIITRMWNKQNNQYQPPSTDYRRTNQQGAGPSGAAPYPTAGTRPSGTATHPAGAAPYPTAGTGPSGTATHPATGARPSGAASTMRPLSPGNFAFVKKGTRVSEATPTASASAQGPSVKPSSDDSDFISFGDALRIVFKGSKRAARPSEQSSPQPEGNDSEQIPLPPNKRHGGAK